MSPQSHIAATESIVVKIRWFGLILGFLYVNIGAESPHILALNAILTLGMAYTIIDTLMSRQGRNFLGQSPLFVSVMEAIFIGLLSYFDGDWNSPFRFYYLLSLICCGIRYSQRTTFATCFLDCLSYGALCWALPPTKVSWFSVMLLPVVMIWVSWAVGSMAQLLRSTADRLRLANEALRENQSQLESRIAERTRELQETQAQVMHQDKMAGFGLLAAGIAHEVGNPLTSISTLIQMLERRDLDDYTREKLGLIGGQLKRIQTILRELMNFSRPAILDRTRFTIREIVDEALNIAKYYGGTKSRKLTAQVDDGLPTMFGIRDQLVQVIFNLLLNAIDATPKGGHIELTARQSEQGIVIHVRDDGSGIPPTQQTTIFQPYFTTKKQGTGLGLFVSRKIVVEHGGVMDFESTVGQGTTFRIQLPVRTS